MFQSHLQEFAGRMVLDLEEIELVEPFVITPDLAVAVRYAADRGDSILDVITELVDRDDASVLEALVTGYWRELNDPTINVVIDAVIEVADSLPNLTAIFVGDVKTQDQTISYTQLSDMSPLLRAFPKLEVLGVRGGGSLEFTDITGPLNLTSLRLEVFWMTTSLLEQLATLPMPKLESFEIWLGNNGQYGSDFTVADVENLLVGLPRTVTNLGLVNSTSAPAVAAMLCRSPITAQLERLDLSKGTLVDDDVRALLASGAFDHLSELDLSENGLSPVYADELGALAITIRTEGQRPLEAASGENAVLE